MIKINESERSKKQAIEVNFDGLVGPTHNYAGLSFGNIASQTFSKIVSHPRQAALQGLKKMKLLMDLGLTQAILPPQERPHLRTLKKLGFTGSDAEILEKAYKTAPHLFAGCYSSSSMWTANAASVSPSADTKDGRVHMTVANLMTHFHRSLEAKSTFKILKKIFPNESLFKIHPPFTKQSGCSDEGAANHNRFCQHYGLPGVELFVYGQDTSDTMDHLPLKYPARQNLSASRKVAKNHLLDKDAVLFVKQNPQAIDQGVFHNDVIAVANETVFLLHELAFEEVETVLKSLEKHCPFSLNIIKISEKELSVLDAVKTYLFNSQLLTQNNGEMVLIAPEECANNPKTQYLIQRILEQDNPIRAVQFMNLRESMQNGGGPACLRLRVVLTERELAAVHPPVILNTERHQQLVNWVNRFYRDTLSPQDLLDPELIEETKAALDELTHLLDLGSIYDFQCV